MDTVKNIATATVQLPIDLTHKVVDLGGNLANTGMDVGRTTVET